MLYVEPKDFEITDGREYVNVGASLEFVDKADPQYMVKRASDTSFFVEGGTSFDLVVRYSDHTEKVLMSAESTAKVDEKQQVVAILVIEPATKNPPVAREPKPAPIDLGVL